MVFLKTIINKPTRHGLLHRSFAHFAGLGAAPLGLGGFRFGLGGSRAGATVEVRMTNVGGVGGNTGGVGSAVWCGFLKCFFSSWMWFLVVSSGGFFSSWVLIMVSGGGFHRFQSFFLFLVLSF